MRWLFQECFSLCKLQGVLIVGSILFGPESLGQLVELFGIRFLHYLKLRQFRIKQSLINTDRIDYLYLMLSGLRDHEATLIHSQPFYYSNYQYYNNYEDLDKDYKDDLSKIRFNLRRKTKGSIVLYETHSSNYVDPPTERLIGPYQPKRSAHCQQIVEQHCTVDDLLFKFIQVFHETNYSDSKNEREECRDKFDILILKYMYSFFQEELGATENQSYQDLAGILQSLKEIGASTKEKLEIMSENNQAQSPQFLEKWYVFQQYWKYVIEAKLQESYKGEKVENFYLLEFCQYVKYFIRQVGKGAMRNILLLAQPETPLWSAIVHPLSVPLTFTFKEATNPPRVLFINLDGRQTYYNLRVANTFPDSVRYISVFQEPLGADLIDTKLENGCDEIVDADFINMNQVHSQLLLRQIRPKDVDGTPLPYNKNIILYPLNSLYLRKAYSLAHQGQQIDKRKLPILDSATDLKWLWEQVIVRQAEQWVPDLTIISYNGYLNIKEEHFKQIVKDLTVLSDHRVILFTNMTGLFKPSEEKEEPNEDYPKDKIELVNEFMGNYMPYKYERVDQEKYFNNLSHFVKISSGSYSLKNRVNHSPHSKFALGKRLIQLQRLASLPEYCQILLFSKQGVDMNGVFKEFSKRQIEENRKESEWWLKKIEEVQKELMELDPDTVLEEDEQLQANTQTKKRQIAYKIKSIKDELRVQEQLVHGEAMDLQGEFASYLANNKEKLLLQNLQNYHYRKAYTGEQEDRNGRLRCYRFSLNQNDGEEILLERYSQIITDEKRTRIFIVNYRTSEEKHCILVGELSDRLSSIKMRKVQERIDQSFGELDINTEKSEVIYLNFSSCFVRDKLYLFWPQEWDLQEQIRRQLLGFQYSPPHVNYILRCSYSLPERSYIVDKLTWRENSDKIPIPRRGCVGLEVPSSESRFFIFGGIYDSRLDFYKGSSEVNLVIVQEDTFTIQTLPKKKDKNNKNNILKPKMNYRIEKSAKTSQEGGTILLSGGYGRSFTNFHTLFSYQNYSVANELDGLKVTRIQSKNHRITRLSHPISVPAIGRFYVGSQGEGQEKFSDDIKDWVLAQGREEKTVGRETISLLQEQMRVREFKSDHKRNYLFGWARTIREKIYVPHCWSPELQIIANGKQYLVCTALKTEKSNNYNIGNFLIPKEEDLVSLCLDQDRLLLLSNSPVLYSLDNRPNNYILYEGSLANITDLVTRRELPMHQRFEFKANLQKQSLKYKTIFTLDDKIFLLGGLNKEANERQDYILQRSKDKLKKKIRRLQCNEDSLELTSPVVVKYKDGYLLYSVILQERTVPKGDNAQSIEDYWKIKIQTFTPNESCQEETLLCGPLMLYHLDFDKGTIVNRKPQFQQPKIIKIIPYTKFSSIALREYIEKVYIKLSRQEDERYAPYLQLLKMMKRQRDEQKITQMLEEHHHRGLTFKNMLQMFKFLLEKHDDLENEQLVKDLRNLSSLMNKHLLQSILQPDFNDSPLYKFIIEDRRSSRKVKFIAIGPLLTTRLRFLRIRYKHELSICLNETNEQELFFNTNVLGCEQIAKERSKGASVDWQEQPTIKKINVTYKA